jgi:predicted transcriptional regulator
MIDARFPQSQKELLRLARGAATQKEFAMLLKVDKSCLSRYESGKLGAPVRVIDECLKIVASELSQSAGGPSITAALEHARMTVKCLEQ